MELSGAKASQSSNQEIELVSNLTNKEHQLAAKSYQNGCHWDLQRPKLDNAVRNYIFGNLYLHAVFHLNGQTTVNGRLSFQPNGINVYAEDGTKLSQTATLGILFRLIQKGIFTVGALGDRKNVDINIKVDQE